MSKKLMILLLALVVAALLAAGASRFGSPVAKGWHWGGKGAHEAGWAWDEGASASPSSLA